MKDGWFGKNLNNFWFSRTVFFFWTSIEKHETSFKHLKCSLDRPWKRLETSLKHSKPVMLIIRSQMGEYGKDTILNIALLLNKGETNLLCSEMDKICVNGQIFIYYLRQNDYSVTNPLANGWGIMKHYGYDSEQIFTHLYPHILSSLDSWHIRTPNNLSSRGYVW